MYVNVIRVSHPVSHPGHPSLRRRSLTCGLNNFFTIWHGPDNDIELQQDFDRFFERTLELTGEVYFQAGAEEVDEQFAEWADLRQNHDWEELEDPMQKMRATMPPGKVLIMDSHSERAPVGEPWLSDLEQWAGSRGDGSSPLFPTQLTHGTVFSWRHLRPATA
jgi:hypothetical protein